jgi:type III secretion protein D
MQPLTHQHMTAPHALEVRILAGEHRHARCPAHDEAIIGASSSCDIVLRDPGLSGKAARLRVHAGGWRLHILAPGTSNEDGIGDADDATRELLRDFGQPVWLGAACITVSRQDDPWNEPGNSQDAQWRQLQDAQQGCTPAASESPPLARGGLSSDSFLRAPSGRRRGRAMALPATIALVLSGIGAIWALRPTEPIHALPAQAASLYPASGTDDYRQRVIAAVAALGLDPGVRVVPNADRAIWVTGWVPSRHQHDLLAQALAQFDPRPVLRVECGDTTEQRAQASLDTFDAVSKVKYLDNGLFQVRAIAASPTVRDAMLAALDRAGVTAGERDIMLADEVKSRFQADAARAALPPIDLAWAGRKLRIHAPRLDEAQGKRLFDLVASTNERLMQVLLPPTFESVPRTLPFRVRTIVGGAQPWLLLDDGTKLLPGGTHDNYRLVAIEDKRVVFENSGTVVVPR